MSTDASADASDTIGTVASISRTVNVMFVFVVSLPVATTSAADSTRALS